MLRYVVTLCVIIHCALAKHELYDGHSLYEVTVDTAEQAEYLISLEDHLNLDVWDTARPGAPGMVLVPPTVKELFLPLLDDAGIQYTVNVENIKQQLELEDSLLAAAANRSHGQRIGLSFDTIHRYAVVDAYLVELARQYPNVVTAVSGGRSFEGRDIKYLRISSSNFEDRSKPIVLMESLIHAREWVTLPATLYAIEKLVIDVTERDLIDEIDWIIVPILNPDGYEHTHTNARFWRKNRATGYSVDDVCMGVDLNRNFDWAWATASSNSATFHGSSGFSEPETTVIQKIIQTYGDRIELFLDIHSHGSYILYGFGNGILPPNSLNINLNGVRMAQAIDAVKIPTNRNYIVGNSNHVLYATSGSAQDYVQSQGVPFSYTYELPSYRNQGGLNGFLVDPSFIRQAGFETWEGIKSGARFALDHFRLRRQG